MKTIYLDSLLVPMRGFVVRGKFGLAIRHVTRRLRGISDHALYFHTEAEVPGPQAFRDVRGCVMVTDRDTDWEWLEGDVTVIKVQDVGEAYWAFVKFYRAQLDLPVIGVTGTHGKTVVKEMIRHILSEDRRVLTSYMNKNRQVSNLDCLIGLDETTEAAVIEMGVQHPDDLTQACEYFKPQIGVITMIGNNHFKECKSLEGYIKAKGRLVDGLGRQGTLVINGDDENIRKIDLSGYRGEVVRFGLGEGLNLRVTDVRVQGNGMAATLYLYGMRRVMYVPGLGVHNIMNALAALGAVRALGVDLERALARLRTFQPAAKQLTVTTGFRGCTLIEDISGSNPEASLKLLAEKAGEREKIAVLGRMEHSGTDSVSFHHRLGEMAAEYGVDVLITYGDVARALAEGAINKGMQAEFVHICEKKEEAISMLRRVVEPKSFVLVKSSMVNDLRELVEVARGEKE